MIAATFQRAVMERIREPELMEEPLQARAYAEADFRSSDAAFLARFRQRLQTWGGPAAERRPLRILDLGCGPGNLSFPIAEALPAATLLALDGAAPMLRLARDRQALEPRRWPALRFELACLPLVPGALGTLPQAFQPPYQVLVSNSVLHHLHEPGVFWTAIRGFAAPGALLVLRDLRRPLNPTALRALVRRHAARAPAVLRRDFAHSLRAAFRPEEVVRQLRAAGLPQLQVAAEGDRYLDVWGSLP